MAKSIGVLFSGTTVCICLIGFLFFSACKSEQENIREGEVYGAERTQSYRDLYSDTWVATDALGRKMPSFEEVGKIKRDQRRVVGIFYITWHTQNLAKLPQPYRANVTQILKEDPAARLQADNPLWYTNSYHWDEPEMGYFLSQDEYVIRKDISMLADAGVDVLIMDVTNAVRYWDEWDFMFKIMLEMRAEGNRVPQFAFWSFNGPSITVVQDLYDHIYKENKYKDLWFYWDDKPLLLYNGNPFIDANGKDIKHPNPHYDSLAATDPENPHYGNPDYADEYYQDYTKEVKDFFTLRTMWWGYYKWGGKRFVGTEDNWSFGYSLAEPEVKDMDPKELLSTHDGAPEEAAVTTAQHPVSMTSENMGVGKSWTRKYGEPKLNQYDLPDSGYVPWLGKTVENPEKYGAYFQERWDEAIAANPQFIYINDWNEWTAGKYQPEDGGTTPWLGRDNPFFFVDQYNAEFNRGIQPVKGNYTDNYYMQMVQNIRRYKGIRPIPRSKGYTKIRIDGDFQDWESIDDRFRDTRGDTFHRDALGYAGIHYVNNSGRNDIITSKVTVDKDHIFFYAETADNLSDPKGENWMLLMIDADHDSNTGWYGYDYLINKEIEDDTTTTLWTYNGNQWEKVSNLTYSYEGNRLEIAIPRAALNLTSDHFTFDFKWSDNAEHLENPISLVTHGDTAPNRRFNYRFIWSK